MTRALPAAGGAVSVYELVGELAGGTALVMAGVSLHPKVRGARDRRRKMREDLLGRPARIEDGVTVEEARPSLASAVHTLSEVVARIDQRTEQLTRNGGGTLADAIHRMEQSIGEKHAENQQDIAELRVTAELNADRLQELHRIAGQAAMRAASADERVQRADQRVRQIAADVDVLTDAALADHAHIWAVLSELGYDRRGEPDAT